MNRRKTRRRRWLGLLIGGLFARPMWAQAPAEAPATPAYAAPGDFQRVADDEETIYAVQRKAYLVNGRIEITPMFAATFTDRFVTSFAPAASVTYHLAENLGLEVFGAYMFPSDSNLTEEIRRKVDLEPKLARLAQMQWGAGAGVQWSPIYGKLHILGSKLGNFNFYLGAGLGAGGSRVACIAGVDLDPATGGGQCPEAEDTETGRAYAPSQTHLMGSVAGGVRFYFSNALGLKLEIRDWLFPSRVHRPDRATQSGQFYSGSIRNVVMVQAGLSFLLGGEDD